MSWIDDLELSEFLSHYLAARRKREEAGQGRKTKRGPVWRVRPLQGGGFAVEQENARPEDGPDALFFERRVAYLTAAVFTALGGPEGAGVTRAPRATGDLAGAGELGEAAAPATYGVPARGPDLAMAARLVQGLLDQPAAMELLLEAVDPAVLAAAEDLATQKTDGDDEPVH